MSGKMKIIDGMHGRSFEIRHKDESGTEYKKDVECAYHRSRKNCSPDCAACELTGSFLKAVCLRGDFTIGVIEEK
jgi:hypothetical protein